MSRDRASVPVISPSLILPLVWLIWSSFVFLVQAIGIFKIFRHHSSPPRPAVSASLPKNEVPHVAVIRPVKDWESAWYDCLASTFRQSYPRDKLTIYLCVESAADPSYPHLQRLVRDFPDFDARIMVEEQDPVLHGSAGNVHNLGPNPKIRNISRAYREAAGDVIWVVDSNVWVSKGVVGRMVDKLYGFRADGSTAKPYKFVHQLPLVVDTTHCARDDETGDAAVAPADRRSRPRLSLSPSPSSPSSSRSPSRGSSSSPLANGGGLLDDMFMATTHAKFYSAINTVGVAPCIVGKSNMFRKSHLDHCTDPSRNPLLRDSDAARGSGIDFFSSYICEDHLIGDLLWRSALPGYANHGLVFGDLAIQPTARMSVADYVGRRVRWLRVRKWTVLAATLVEPGVESLLCCAYLSLALTSLPWFHSTLGLPQTWSAAAAVWVVAVTAWMLIDRFLYCKLHARQSVEADPNTPSFARGALRPGGVGLVPMRSWLPAWLAREFLALPIWTWAVLLGTTVSWRGRRFTVRMDMSVVEIPAPPSSAACADSSAPPSTPLARSSPAIHITPDTPEAAGLMSKDHVD